MDFVYNYDKLPKRNNGEYLPEAVVVKFHSLNNNAEPFVEEMTHTIAILVSYDEWRVGKNYVISKQFPLVLS